MILQQKWESTSGVFSVLLMVSPIKPLCTLSPSFLQVLDEIRSAFDVRRGVDRQFPGRRRRLDARFLRRRWQRRRLPFRPLLLFQFGGDGDHPKTRQQPQKKISLTQPQESLRGSADEPQGERVKEGWSIPWYGVLTVVEKKFQTRGRKRARERKRERERGDPNTVRPYRKEGRKEGRKERRKEGKKEGREKGEEKKNLNKIRPFWHGCIVLGMKELG